MSASGRGGRDTGAPVWGGGELDDEDALQVARRHLEERGELPAAGSAYTWTLARRTLVRGRIVRCLESRAESQRSEPGVVSLSARSTYDDLGEYHLDPPQDPARPPKSVRLVKRGSEAVRPCPSPCDGGSVKCPECSGRRTVRCEPLTVCEGCGNKNSCLNCRADDGEKGSGSAASSGPGRPAGELRKCGECGERGVACRLCLGRGEVDCLDCDGRGRRDCPRCERSGTVEHEECGGTGSHTTWTEGAISRRPETKTLRWPEHGVPLWVWRKARDRGGWRTTELLGYGRSFDGLDDETAKGLDPALARTGNEIARKVTLKTLPLTRIEVPLLPDRVLYAHPARAAHSEDPYSYEVFAVPSRQRTLQIAVAAVGALAVLTVLWWLLVP